MKGCVFFFLLYFLIVSADETEGSVFEYITVTEIQSYEAPEEDTSVDSSIDDVGQPIEDEEDSESEEDEEVTQSATEDSAAEMATVPVGDTESIDNTSAQYYSQDESEENVSQDLYDLSEENIELLQENQELSEANEDLKTLLEDALEKTSEYRNYEIQVLTELENEIENLDEYNNVLVYVEPDDGEDESDDDVLEASVALIFIIGLGFIFLIFHSVRLILDSFVIEGLKPALYALLVDTTILVFLWCLTALIDFVDLFDEDLIDFWTVLVGFAIFILFWLLLGVFLLLTSHSFARAWEKFEDSLLEEDNVLSEGAQKYSVMRAEFIFPIYLPALTESYQRSDFDFSEYLIWALGSVIAKTFHVTWLGYSLIVGAIVVWRLVIFGNYIAEFIVLWVVPVFLILMGAIILLKLKKVLSELIPETDSEFTIEFERSFNQEELMKKLPLPVYLRGKLHKIDESEGEKRYLCMSLNPMKLTCAYIFLGRAPSRHEILLWYDSYGAKFLTICLQFISIVNTFWITVIFLYYTPMITDQFNDEGIIFILVACIFWLFTTIYLIPLLFRYTTLSTKIEMMKDRTCIEQAIFQSYKERIKRNFRLYREFKLVYREIKKAAEEEEKEAILLTMKKLLGEAFLLVAPLSRKTIHVSEIDEVMRLLGVKLNEDELRVFAKECEPDLELHIGLTGFKNAIERILYGYELKPEEVLKFILKEFLLSKRSKVLTLDLMNEFFEEWYWHMTDEDIAGFMNEIQYLSDMGKLKIKEIGNQIRVDLQGLPS